MSKFNKSILEKYSKDLETIRICEIVNFEQPNKYIVTDTNYDQSYTIPVLTAGQTFILGYTDEIDNIYDASKENPVIIFDDFTGAFKWVDFPFKVKSSAIKILKSKEKFVSLRYIYHLMGKIGYSSAEHKRLWISFYSQIQIDLPSLEVQQEIVRILDNLTELITELITELTARKKQFEYYRNQLLSQNSDEIFERKKLGEIALFRRGSFPQPYGESRWYGGEGAMPFIQVIDVASSGLRLNSKSKQSISTLAMPKSVFAPKDTVIVTLQGSIGRVAITQYDSYIDRTIAIFEYFKIEINKRYFAYQIERKFGIEKEFARGSTLKTITKEEFTQFEIPIPSLDEQQRIVDILDKFDKLVNDISEGIPAEIAARQKQYEYYRDKLLTFKEVGNESI